MFILSTTNKSALALILWLIYVCVCRKMSGTHSGSCLWDFSVADKEICAIKQDILRRTPFILRKITYLVILLVIEDQKQ